MYKTLSNIQKQHFLEISGTEYIDYEISGKFMTKYPYNNKEWSLSPWSFTFILEENTGYFICELDHRMTNNRIIGWDQDGNKLSSEITSKYFKPHF
ncbi:MAG: hypothetical protein A2309_14210 [Bacteroidetes bacterium RIFOXYB2_FULL_35_7]|nr:MAG: hypothetical protein A2X01_18765 [Bacteroidetes bacterium GWF2_35_48]OFY93269.1 MAG: hypothetical protein A2309_14210 [Bacteroidetes bacterium RIFOXYB2_FULL_35_7]OFY98711.1 MAG: hypothetical protein A2491_01905 [Bacteroidetes bacterium RIFOXYC12_FULL_35_7]